MTEHLGQPTMSTSTTPSHSPPHLLTQPRPTTTLPGPAASTTRTLTMMSTLTTSCAEHGPISLFWIMRIQNALALNEQNVWTKLWIYINEEYHYFDRLYDRVITKVSYRSPRLQWHCLQWHPAYSDTFGMSRMIGLLVNFLCLQWQSGYSDTFPMSRGCHCKRGDLYNYLFYGFLDPSTYVCCYYHSITDLSSV